MNTLIMRLVSMAGTALIEPFLRKARLRAAAQQLEMIECGRKAVVILAALMVCVVIMAGGILLIPLALCLFMPWQPHTKVLVGCLFGVVYLVAPLAAALSLVSERRWMRLAGANDVVNDVLRER